MSKMEWFGVDMGHLRSLEMAPLDTVHTSSSFRCNYVHILAHSDFLFDCYMRYTNTLMYVCMYILHHF